MPELKDIRDHIAKTPQTDPNKFDRPDFKRYPLMPLTKDNKPFYDAAGHPTVLHNPMEEDQFYKANPDAPRVIDPQDQADETRKMREEHAAMKAKLDALGASPVSAKGDDKGDDKGDAKSDDKGDNSSTPVTTEQVQNEALSRGGSANKVSGLSRPQPSAPKPGSKLS